MPPASIPRLLAGPALDAGPESLAAHLARLGRVPHDAPREIIAALEATGLHGRGGAGFPVGTKWRGLAERWSGSAVIVANGAEGEPASRKDRTLMATRPHLVVDGALLAAEAIGAAEVIFYLGTEHGEATAAMRRAIDGRRATTRHSMRLVAAPIGYVAGEATAAVHFINAADARPLNTPPRMSEAGVDGRPTLVQNVESLAYAALIARFGDAWYRTAGRNGAAGTALVTISGAGLRPTVREIELGTPLGEIVGASTADGPPAAVVLGGYFGTWSKAGDVWDLPLSPSAMHDANLSFGCGMIGLLPAEACGVEATARIMSFMAAASAAQCGPCIHGLRGIGAGVERVAAGRAEATDLENLRRWTGLIAGRGACRHPDGAAQLMASALDVFAADFAWHVRAGRCSIAGSARAEVA
jgi:NADH:ubiquinone oxidoreductase subunit F (NADH-binding)